VERPPASSRPAGKEERDQSDGGSPPTPAAATVIETADAQAQTAADGVQLFLHPQPSVRSALRPAENQRRRPPPPPPKAAATASHARAQQVGRTVASSYDDGDSYYDDDGSFASSSVSEGYGAQGGGGGRIRERRLLPPPPVVFIEGEGRNASWRPSDDDRLGDTRLILTAAATQGDGNGDEKLGGPGDASPDALEIRLTTGRLEATADSEPEKLGQSEGGQDDVWVELAGMLAVTASDPTAGQPSPSVAATAAAATEGGSASSAEVPAVSQELVGLMREVVGQQKEMGEERSALMQVRKEAF